LKESLRTPKIVNNEMTHTKISKLGDETDVVEVEVGVVDVVGVLIVTMTVSCPKDMPSVNTIV